MLGLQSIIMKALVLNEIKQALVVQEVEKPTLAPQEVLVQIKSAAINHRDIYITQGLYAAIQTPAILGSDGAGLVVELGEGVATEWLNKSVVINPSIGWNDEPVQPRAYDILGMPTKGCFSTYVKVPVSQLQIKPRHLSWQEAAALPLAGLTAYRALFSKAKLQKGERVLISGVGGGVALFACQFAIAMGAEVWVTSGSQDKIDKAIALGAKGGVSYREEKWHKKLKEEAKGGFDVIIDSAGGDGFQYFLDIANMGARIVFYGGTKGKFTVNPQKMFWKQITMFGSTMGNAQEFVKMIDFVNETKLKPVVDSVWELERGQDAFDYMNAAKQFGKIVFSISN